MNFKGVPIKNNYLKIIFDNEIKILLNGKIIQKFSYENFFDNFVIDNKLIINKIINYAKTNINFLGLFFSNTGIKNLNSGISVFLFPYIKKIHVFYTDKFYIYSDNYKYYLNIKNKFQFVFENTKNFVYEKISFISKYKINLDDIFNIEDIKKFIFKSKIKKLTLIGIKKIRLNSLNNSTLDYLKLQHINFVTGLLKVEKLNKLVINNIIKIKGKIISKKFKKLTTLIFTNIEEFDENVLENIFYIKPKNIIINKNMLSFIYSYIKVPFFINNLNLIYLESITNNPKSLTLKNINNIHIASSLINTYIIENSQKTFLNINNIIQNDLKKIILNFSNINTLKINFSLNNKLNNISLKLNNINNLIFIFNFNSGDVKNFLIDYKTFIYLIEQIYKFSTNKQIKNIFLKINFLILPTINDVNLKDLFKLDNYLNIYLNNLITNKNSQNNKIENEIIFIIFNIINKLEQYTYNKNKLEFYFPEFFDKKKINNIFVKTKTKINNI